MNLVNSARPTSFSRGLMAGLRGVWTPVPPRGKRVSAPRYNCVELKTIRNFLQIAHARSVVYVVCVSTVFGKGWGSGIGEKGGRLWLRGVVLKINVFCILLFQIMLVWLCCYSDHIPARPIFVMHHSRAPAERYIQASLNQGWARRQRTPGNEGGVKIARRAVGERLPEESLGSATTKIFPNNFFPIMSA